MQIVWKFCWSAKFFLPSLLILLAALYFFLPFSSEPADTSGVDPLAPVEVVAEGFKEPTGLLVDQSGAIFVSDRQAGEVIKINESGRESIVSNLKRPVGLSFDDGGKLLVVEEGRGRLLRLDGNGTPTTLARGIKKPRWVAVAAEQGTIYISAKGLRSQRDRGDDDDDDEEHGEVILRFSDGQLSVFIDGFKGLQSLVFHDQALFAAAKGLKRDRDRDGGVFQIPIQPDGSAGPVIRLTQSEIKKAFGLVRDRLGALYVSAEELGLKKKVKDAIGKVAPDGVVTLFASKLKEPRGLALDDSGHLYVAVEKVVQDSRRGKERKTKESGGIIRFRAPPKPALAVPSSTNQSPIPATGRTEPHSRIDAFLNHAALPQAISEDGNFSLSLSLTPNAGNFLDVFTTAHSGQGLTSAPAEFTIVHKNMPPVANAGPDQNTFRGALVVLDGAQSRDPEGASLTFQWTLVSQPAGSAITLNNPTSATPQFTPLLLGDYLFQLLVNDGQLDSAPDTVKITAVNRPPTANAGGPYSGTVGVPIQFSGSGNDPDADAITLAWAFGDGGIATGAAPTHTYATPGAFTVTLTVTDSFGASALSQATATVSAALTLSSIGDKVLNLGETLIFTVSATNPGGGPVSLFGSPLPLPNHATFNAATGLFTFTPDTTQVGSFQLTFTAVSGDQSASETIMITVPSRPPGGTTAVRGLVENLNDTPLGNVKVTLKSTGQTAFSGTDGFFTISGIPSGRQELIVNGREANFGVFAILAVPVNLIVGVLNTLPSAITLPDVDVDAEVQVSPT
ncbi:MAG: PKD domain-containing protein, partial [Deltaproteobacteria bacterium]|nr:PKD domain-containing protein [Deltaproteobacteria bacterium]